MKTQAKPWDAIIDAAEERRAFTSDDKARAASPFLCSVGERAKALGVPFYAPSSAIYLLGITFMIDVQDNDFPKARRTHSLIKRWGAHWSEERLKKEQERKN